MKYIILLLFLISQIYSQEEDYFQIDDIYEILFHKKEYKITKEVTLVILPLTLISTNTIKANIKGDSEFSLIIKDKKLEDKKEYNFTFNDYLETAIYDEENQVFFMTFGVTEPEKNNILLTVDCLTLPYESLFVNVTKEYCENVKNNIKELMEKAYIYLDYAKNPKQPDGFDNYFEKVDFIKDLNDIKTEGRTFYEFYRDIRSALGKFKDMHLNIANQVTPSGIDLEKSVAIIPFYFSIKKDENDNNKPKLYANLIPDYVATFFEDNIEQLMKVNGQPLKSINGNDPFDYIQDFIGNKYFQTKNRHATFSNNIFGNKACTISLIFYPLTKEELTDITFNFENGESLTLDYYFLLFKSDSFTEEFNNFYQETINYNKAKLIFPSFFEIKKNFFKKKNIIQKNFNEKTFKLLENKNLKDEKQDNEDKDKDGWDLIFLDDDNNAKMRCKVDDIYEVNVFVQIDFMFQNVQKAEETLVNCSELFHSNDFPIIVIQARNGGGFAIFSYYLMELLQTNIDSTEYISYKPDKILFEGNFGHSNFDKCDSANPKKDNQIITDEYEDNIKHKRTPIYNFFTKNVKKEFLANRVRLHSKNHNKKPTEIIVFTDGFSYSATSLFIKGLQKEGGAIIVGYLGNPKIPGKEEFDGSQSPSLVQFFENTKYAKNLKNAGFVIHGITVGETFLNPYEKNQIPREYQLNPVDERVDIYETYSDDLYEEFVTEGLKIFEKYKTQCNPKNKNLTLFHEDCYNISNTSSIIHGGKLCNEDGTWSEECAPIYCDFGYYYDYYTQKCEINVCYSKEEDKDKDKDKGLSKKTLAIIIVCSAIGLILIVVIIIFICKRRHKETDSEKIESVDKGRLVED